MASIKGCSVAVAGTAAGVISPAGHTTGLGWQSKERALQMYPEGGSLSAIGRVLEYSA